jgi:phosphoribosyl 1,2-cyclic phosphodiesterase
LRLSVLASGSSGNATYLESGPGTGVLVDAGLSCRRISARLAERGTSLEDVRAVLLTHGHSDHVCGVPSLVRELGIPIYSAPGVGEGLGATVVEAGEELRIGGLSATFFAVPHDSATYGVRLSGGGHTVALATDLGEVSGQTLRWMSGAEAAILEANHEPEWLMRGPYSPRLKRRISSPSGHLSNRQAAEAALSLASRGLKDLVLAHLSEKNNSPARACGTVKSVLRGAGFGGVRVRVALAGHATPWIEVGAPLEAEGYAYHYEGVSGAARLFEAE